MGYKTNSIRNLRTLDAWRGEVLTIDLGKTQDDTLRAWMKKDPNSSTYRSFNILSNRYLVLTAEKASDYLDIDENVTEAVAGKWYFDVEQSTNFNDPELTKTIFRGTILFQNDITGSNGVEVLNPTVTLTFIGLSDTPIDYTGQELKTVKVNGTADGIVFVDPDFTDQQIADLIAHLADIANPHSVTQTQIGLSNVDNTSDANKPISTATQTALNLKADNSALTTHTSNIANPHSVTKAQVGLTNVDDTTDLNKPISTATQAVIDALPYTLSAACSDINSDLAVGTNKARFAMPFGMELTEVFTGLGDVPTGSNFITDIQLNGTTILSTLISIDAGENTSLTATTPPVISTTTIPKGGIITVEFTQIGAINTGKSHTINLTGTKT